MSDSPRATLIVFNKGSQIVTYPGGAFIPGSKPTPVAAEHEEHVRKLLTRYPLLLVEGSGDVAAANRAIAEKEAALKSKDQQIAELVEQNKKLTALLTASPDTSAPSPAVVEEAKAPEPAPEVKPAGKGKQRLI